MILVLWSGDEAVRKAVCDLAKTIPEVRAFPFSWTRWKNWEEYPPIVFIEGERVLGFSAATFSTRSGYAYEYFIGVDPEARGRRIGWKLVDFMLSQARERGMLRLKLKSETAGAHKFWASFGLRPFARIGEQLCWDADIAPVAGASGLAEWMLHADMHAPIPEASMRRWLSTGVEILQPEKAEELVR